MTEISVPFLNADKNRDGILSQEEINEISGSYRDAVALIKSEIDLRQTSIAQDITQCLTEADANGNGYIDEPLLFGNDEHQNLLTKLKEKRLGSNDWSYSFRNYDETTGPGQSLSVKTMLHLIEKANSSEDENYDATERVKSLIELKKFYRGVYSFPIKESTTVGNYFMDAKKEEA